jgi:RimJ/RimL family protein N-acetyltransferase
MTNIKINWQPENLENELVKIVPLHESDYTKLFAVAADPIIWEQHPASDRYKKEVFQLFFDGAVLGKTAFLIIEKKTNTIIGSTRYYDYKPENSSIAIGYTFLAKEYWGGTFNKAKKKLLIDYAFNFVDNVYFHISTTNTRSQLAITKIGAMKLGEINFENNGQQLPHFEYVIQKQNWVA